MPKVLVVIPTYNHARYLAEAIESVLAQTFLDFHLVVVDDGSTDDTQKILAVYKDKISVITQDNMGIGHARNNGAVIIDSDYIAFHDADDIWTPCFLERQLSVIENVPEAGFVWADSVCFTDDNSPNYTANTQEPYFTIEDAYSQLFRGYAIPVPGVLMRRTVFNEVGGFDISLKCNEDWDMWLRICERYKIIHIHECLVFIRRHFGNYSWDRSFCAAKEILMNEKIFPGRLLNPDDSYNTVLARYCMLTIVNAALIKQVNYDQLIDEWHCYKSKSSSKEGDWLNLFSSAVGDAVSHIQKNDLLPDNETMSKLADALFTDIALSSKAYSCACQSLAWSCVEKDKLVSTKFARSAIRKTPELLKNRGLLKIAIGMDVKHKRNI